MEVKSQDGSLAYNNPIFRESSETLDRQLLQQNPKRPDPDQFQKIEQKSTGSSLKSPSTASGGARYRECLKNHAASVGGNVLDGCGEFMPAGEDGTFEALKCAACNCHRNFHRKELDGRGADDFTRPLQLPPPLPSPTFKHHHQRIAMNHHWSPMVPPVKIAFGSAGGGSGGTDSSSEDLNFNAFQSNAGAHPPPPPPFVLSKKRFRTKFTQEQKDRMLEFAEKVSWRIPKEDDAEVQRFCAEVGVKRQVLKVWMHNNKSASKKQNQQEL